ncbi:MAG: type VI secretion system-associated protein TagO [Pseudomonadota bacterium]|nr:type VI secretion system-associated protein TagO [Pseudomonadota bacterium]
MFSFLALLAACSGSPEEVATAYLEVEKGGDRRAAYDVMCRSDRDAKPFEEFAPDDDSLMPFVRAMAERTTYKVKERAETDSTAEVTFEYTGPDTKARMKELTDAAGDSPDYDAVFRTIGEEVKAGKITTTHTSTLTFTLHKEDGEWCVFQDFAAAKAEEERQKAELRALTIETAKTVGATFEGLGAWDTAKEQYESILKEDPENAEARAKVAEMERKLSEPGHQWRVTDETNPMDDSRTVVLTVKAAETFRYHTGASKRPTLVLRCKSRKLEVYINNDASADDAWDGTRVKLRFDDKPLQRVSATESTSRDALFLSKPGPLLDQMAASNKMLYEFTPFSSAPALVSFDVSGLGAKIAPLYEACGIRK